MTMVRLKVGLRNLKFTSRKQLILDLELLLMQRDVFYALDVFVSQRMLLVMIP